MKSLSSLLLVIFITISGLHLIFAQNNSSDHYFLPIYKKGDSYYGNGVRWMLHKQDSVQFYLFGEQHGIGEIPNIIQFIHKELNKNDNFVLVLEMDSWTTGKISDWGVDEFIQHYPHTIAFDYDEEIDLIRSAEKHNEIWGMDQMITAIHPYQRLIKLAPNGQAKRLVRGAFLKASLKTGKYLRQTNQKDFNAIKNAFGASLTGEAREILEHLEISMRIYTTWQAGQRGEISKQVSVTLREQFMIDQFDSYMMKNPKQKAVFKMGGAHLVKGIGPNGVETLGNHIIRSTNQKELKTLSVGLFNYHKGLPFVPENIFEKSDIVLVDFERYAQEKPDSLLQQLSESNRLLLKRYDAVILFNNAQRAQKNFVSSYEKKFKSNLISDVSIGGILVLLCLTMIIPLILYRFSKSEQTNGYHNYCKLLGHIFLASLLAIIVFSYQIFAIIKGIDLSLIKDASISIWLFIALFLVAIYFVFRIIQFVKNETKKKRTAYLVLMIVCYTGFICFMYYWNIGGMISF